MSPEVEAPQVNLPSPRRLFRRLVLVHFLRLRLDGGRGARPRSCSGARTGSQ
jgi:hypothetical protein